MNYSNNNDPLHGVTLKTILTLLQEKYGWQGLADRIRINCFSHDPSIQSSLKFLRKTPWARKKVENLYVRTKWPAPEVTSETPEGSGNEKIRRVQKKAEPQKAEPLQQLKQPLKLSQREQTRIIRHKVPGVKRWISATKRTDHWFFTVKHPLFNCSHSNTLASSEDQSLPPQQP